MPLDRSAEAIDLAQAHESMKIVFAPWQRSYPAGRATALLERGECAKQVPIGRRAMMQRASEPPRIRSVVAVEGHPDDVELSALGTLIKLRERGTRITIVSITDGGGGSYYDRGVSKSIAAIRAGEASAVASRLNGEWLTLGATDAYLYDTPELRARLASVFRRAECDLVLAPPPTDYHYDHMNAGQLAFSAAYYSQVGGSEVEGTPLAATPAVFYFDSIMGLEFDPAFYIDISPVIEEKKELAGLHESQMANMKAIGGWTLVEYIDIVGRFRGLQSGVVYAEGFRAATRWPRIRAFETFPA
jgi:LmbE family N-acetylglucosaminyl deacetylase